MKKVLIYGDSNVWGDNFITGERIPDEKQWVNILRRKQLNFLFIQEGLPGRTAGDYEEEKTYKNGKEAFKTIFRTNAPVDIVIIALGTNDLQIKYNQSSKQIVDNLLNFEKIMEEMYDDLEDRKKFFINSKMPQIYYVMPINFDYLDRAKVIFNESSEFKRKEIIDYFRNDDKKVIVLEKASLFPDGIHLNYEGHEQMALVVEEVLKNG